MKKSKNRKRSKNDRRVKRETVDFTKRDKLFYPFFIDERNKPRHKIFTDIEDDRRWRPDRIFKGPLLFDGSKAIREVYVRKYVKSQNIPYLSVRFKNPRETIVCERRRQRRINLFRIGKAGRGKKIFKDRKWNENSYIVCRKR